MAKGASPQNENTGIRTFSLKTKTFFITLALTFGIGIIVLVTGFALYMNGVFYEYCINAWNLANAEAAIQDKEQIREKCDEILKIYDSYTDEERMAENSTKTANEASSQDRADFSKDYLAAFEPTMDEQFDAIRETMRTLQARNGPLNAFIVAIDQEKQRMIYLIDADPKIATFVWPGTWDHYEADELDVLVNGRELSKFEKRMGMAKGVQAVITDIDPYGRRCTGGATLYETDRYTVMACVDDRLDPIIAISKVFLRQFFFLMLAIVLIASLIGMLLMRKYLAKPINRMAKAAKAYSEDPQRLDSPRRHFGDLDIRTGDELENLALTMQEMEEDLAVYVNDLTRVTAERERIVTELSLASRIQESMLPKQFPASLKQLGIDVHASMVPAKEVGGDFYDFFPIDDDHLALAIADVAGKGIPAALFMTSSKILLSAGVGEGRSPAKVLEIVNERICANNPEEMFVTVWLGVLEISTGRLITANAGHEYPVLITAKGQAELVRDKHGFVIGGMEGITYSDYELQLQPGEKIFVYTDGVTEATAASKELFGTDRLLEALSGDADAGPKQLLQNVTAAVDAFVGEEEQFDDMTMLCLEYRGTAPDDGVQE